MQERIILDIVGVNLPQLFSFLFMFIGKYWTHKKNKNLIETMIEPRNYYLIYREVYDTCTMNLIYSRCFWQLTFYLLRLIDASAKRSTSEKQQRKHEKYLGRTFNIKR